MLVARALKNSQLTCGETYAYFGDRTLDPVLLVRGYPVTRTARLIHRLKNFLVSCAKLKIWKAFFIPADRLNKVVHLKYLHVKITQSAAREIKAKES